VATAVLVLVHTPPPMLSVSVMQEAYAYIIRSRNGGRMGGNRDRLKWHNSRWAVYK